MREREGMWGLAMPCLRFIRTNLFENDASAEEENEGVSNI